MDTPYYKIGHATNVARRLWQINNHSPYQCVLLHAMPIDCQTEGEYLWHSIFKSTRAKGEWFALTKTQIALFCACFGGSINALHYQIYRDNQPLFLAVMDESK